MSKPIPFRLDRAVAANLSDQLADGLRDAIVSGYYRKGETLPTIVQLAKQLGTSVQVPRAAIAALASENLISTRRGVGCTVVGRNPSVWKGRVLGIVPAERENAYYASTFLGEMRRALNAAGYLFEVVALDRRSVESFNWGPLDSALQRNLDLAFPLHCPPPVLRRLERMGIPFATKQSRADSGFPGPQIGDISKFLEQCRAANVRRVLIAGIDAKPEFDDFCARFSDAGLTVEPVPVRCLQGPGYLERLERNGMKLAMKRFSKPRATWPQLIFWADDFLATGGLLGLAMRSVSIPRDVFAVTIANKGFVPAYPRTLARFEFDPAATARTASAQIIGRLAGSPAAPIPELVRYVPGESLPARVGRNAPDPRG